ncbi:MAG: acyl carrier protein [Planctomycetota bacterium]
MLIRAAQLAERLEAAIRAQLGLADDADLDALPLRDFGGDSLDLVEFMIELEDFCDGAVDISRDDEIATFGDLIRAILAAKRK